MAETSATAPGKSILLGEHSVVYNRPAIAVPITQIRVKTTVSNLNKDGIWIESNEIGMKTELQNLADDHPLRIAISGVKEVIQVSQLPPCHIQIDSTIPIAAGLGSGAAVSVSLIRALAKFLEHPLSDIVVSSLAYRVEQRLHGTPSGIDNTVITYEKPIYFVKNQPFAILRVAEPITLVIGDSGIKSPTGEAVAGVRSRWQNDVHTYEAAFLSIAHLVEMGRQAITNGPSDILGTLMTKNHILLQQIGVSCSHLDLLVEAALSAGALGAKLSGGGQGGNMIALATPQNARKIAEALESAGATRTIITTIYPS